MSRHDVLFKNYNYKYSISPINIETCLNFLSKDLSTTKKKYRYLELGCGQGLSLNIHAAANSGEFWGVDCNPSRAVMTDDIARASGANVNICNQTFEAFCQRTDLPDFDIIVLRNIWGHLSESDQERIADFVRRKLALGGAFYISYNTPSGKWGKLAPVRELIKLYYDRAAIQSDDMSAKIKNAAVFMERVIEKTSDSKQPSLINEIEQLKNARLSDTVNEYIADHWQLFSFADITDILSDAKLSFACHSEFLENVDSLLLSSESIPFLNEITDPVLKEMARDFLSDHCRRSDIWVKGARALNRIERTKALAGLRFILPKHIETTDLEVSFPAGKLTMQDNIYRLILECLAENDYAPKSADDLVNYYQLRQVNRAGILDALIVLLSLRTILPVQSDETINQVKSSTDALNTYLLEQAVHSDVIHHLASPVTGGGIEVSRIHQLFLLARLEEASASDEWATLAWQLISQQEQITAIENKPIASAEEGLNVLKAMAQQFADKKLPILKALGIVD